MVGGAALTGTDRIELYTEGYAKAFHLASDLGFPTTELENIISKQSAIDPYIAAATKARELGLGINAGHDLDLNNLGFFAQNIPWIDEVSIGHALVCDALYLGYENTVQMYKRQLML